MMYSIFIRIFIFLITIVQCFGWESTLQGIEDMPGTINSYSIFDPNKILVGNTYSVPMQQKLTKFNLDDYDDNGDNVHVYTSNYFRDRTVISYSNTGVMMPKKRIKARCMRVNRLKEKPSTKSAYNLRSKGPDYDSAQTRPAKRRRYIHKTSRTDETRIKVDKTETARKFAEADKEFDSFRWIFGYLDYLDKDSSGRAIIPLTYINLKEDIYNKSNNYIEKFNISNIIRSGVKKCDSLVLLEKKIRSSDDPYMLYIRELRWIFSYLDYLDKDSDGKAIIPVHIMPTEIIYDEEKKYVLSLEEIKYLLDDYIKKYSIKAKLKFSNVDIPIQYQEMDSKISVEEPECIKIHENSESTQISKKHFLKGDGYKNNRKAIFRFFLIIFEDNQIDQESKKTEANTSEPKKEKLKFVRFFKLTENLGIPDSAALGYINGAIEEIRGTLATYGLSSADSENRFKEFEDLYEKLKSYSKKKIKCGLTKLKKMEEKLQESLDKINQ